MNIIITHLKYKINMNYPDFDEIPVTVHCYILATNFTVKIQELFDSINITPYIIVPKKRGRRKKMDYINPNTNIPVGSIISLELNNQHRGANLKCKNYSNNGKNYFRNAITIVMSIHSKIINFKLYANGKIQMTGCKSKEQAIDCVKYLWEHMRERTTTFTFKDEKIPYPVIYIASVMRNVTFSLGFLVDRTKLDYYVNTETEYRSTYETSMHHPNVNISFPIRTDFTKSDIAKIVYKDSTWELSTVPYTEFFETQTNTEKTKMLRTVRHITFLVFQSGKTIISGINRDAMRPSYYEFIEMIGKCHMTIREVLK